MSDKVEVNNGGMGLCSVLTIIFVLAKLFKLITWSWWIVFSPLLVGFVIAALLVAFAFVVAGIAVYMAGK